ncbi:MAG: flagellar export protein FliJ [Deltaproteobacteria bacterium]|nr:flagellar export protein FliJ [Deltaproteobacteria bacterium]
MYHFSLETVLRHRKHIEETLQKEFVRTKKDLFMANESVASLEEIRERKLRELQEKQGSGATVSGIMLYDNYIRQLSIDIERQIKSVIELEDRLRQKRSELIEAMKRRKTLDRLKEKEWQAYRKEMERREQIAMSEIAVSGFNMRKQVQ